MIRLVKGDQQTMPLDTLAGRLVIGIFIIGRVWSVLLGGARVR